jgi:hypothetical protein
MADIAQFRTVSDAREWTLNAAVKSRGQMIRQTRPDLMATITAAYDAKAAELRGGGA